MNMKKRTMTREEETMAKKDGLETGGLCCPHCSDSKYPCVNMEKQMRKAEEEAEGNKQKRDG